MNGMRVLVVGGGGREHALVWKIAQSPRVVQVWVAPGNAGTVREEKMMNVALKATDCEGLLAWAKKEKPDLTIVGPDDPLSLGIVDLFQAEGFRIFGPTKAAARLEWSKSFTKDFLKRHVIPTAAYAVFDDLPKAEKYLHEHPLPIVVKADGLAAGKGVVVAQTLDEAVAFARSCLSGERFGAAGARIVIEEWMEGEEASFTALVDGEHFISFPTAQDHKRVNDGNTGPNTGGMGAYSPAPVADAVYERIIETIVAPIVSGMHAEGNPFVGFLYVGLMIHHGLPRVVEINARFGDPETQPIMMRLTSDLMDLLEAAVDGTLAGMQMALDPRAAVCTVMASGGYPGKYATGEVISGIEEAERLEGVKVFHAGTSVRDEQLVTSGGRVLGVTALGETIAAARARSYEAVSKIQFTNMHVRTDIAGNS